MYTDMDQTRITRKNFESNYGGWLENRWVVDDGYDVPLEVKVPVPDSDKIDDFEVKVLTHGNWPPMKEQICQLPRELKTYQVRFEFWYIRCHGSRQLTWLFDNGHVELLAVRGMRKKYTLTLKVFQAAILLLFNKPEYCHDDATIKVSEIIRETNMTSENFKSGMLKLCEPKKNILNK